MRGNARECARRARGDSAHPWREFSHQERAQTATGSRIRDGSAAHFPRDDRAIALDPDARPRTLRMHVAWYQSMALLVGTYRVPGRSKLSDSPIRIRIPHPHPHPHPRARQPPNRRTPPRFSRSASAQATSCCRSWSASRRDTRRSSSSMQRSRRRASVDEPGFDGLAPRVAASRPHALNRWRRGDIPGRPAPRFASSPVPRFAAQYADIERRIAYARQPE